MRNKELLRCLESKCVLDRPNGSRSGLAALSGVEGNEREALEALAAAGVVSELEGTKAIAECYRLPFLDLDVRSLLPNVCKIIPYEFAARYRILPIARHGSVITLAVGLPLDLFAEDYVSFSTGLFIERVVVCASVLSKAIEYVYKANSEEAFVDSNDSDKLTSGAGIPNVTKNYNKNIYSQDYRSASGGNLESQVILQAWRECNLEEEGSRASLGKENLDFVNSVEQAATLSDVINSSESWDSLAELPIYAEPNNGLLSGDESALLDLEGTPGAKNFSDLSHLSSSLASEESMADNDREASQGHASGLTDTTSSWHTPKMPSLSSLYGDEEEEAAAYAALLKANDDAEKWADLPNVPSAQDEIEGAVNYETQDANSEEASCVATPVSSLASLPGGALEASLLAGVLPDHSGRESTTLATPKAATPKVADAFEAEKQASGLCLTEEQLFARGGECPINWLQGLLLQGARLGASDLVRQQTGSVGANRHELFWRVGTELIPANTDVISNKARTVVIGEVFHFPSCQS